MKDEKNDEMNNIFDQSLSASSEYIMHSNILRSEEWKISSGLNYSQEKINVSIVHARQDIALIAIIIFSIKEKLEKISNKISITIFLLFIIAVSQIILSVYAIKHW